MLIRCNSVGNECHRMKLRQQMVVMGLICLILFVLEAQKRPPVNKLLCRLLRSSCCIVIIADNLHHLMLESVELRGSVYDLRD